VFGVDLRVKGDLVVVREVVEVEHGSKGKDSRGFWGRYTGQYFQTVEYDPAENLKPKESAGEPRIFLFSNTCFGIYVPFST
jgi:hypothetical protein